MAETTHRETVVLGVEDHLSGAARAAEGALGRLEAQIAREQSALSRLETSLVAAKGAMKGIASGDANGVVNVAAYRRAQSAVTTLGDRMAGQKDKIEGLKDKLGALQHGAEKAGHAAHGAHPPFRAIGQAAKLVGGEAGQMTAELTHAAHILLKLGPYVAAAVVGFVALTSVFVGFVEIITKGIEGASEYRDELIELSSAGVTLQNSQRASMVAAEGLYETIEKVAHGSATATDEIKGYAVELRNARFRGEELEKTLETAAMVSAGGGAKMAKQYLEVAKSVRFLGGNVDALSERMKKKFGEVAEAKLLSVGVQVRKLKENIAYLFTGADIEPFLKGMQDIFGLFDKNTDSAKALRDAISKVTEFGIGAMLRFALVLVNGYIWLQNHETAWEAIKLAIKGVVIGLGVLAGAIALAFAVAGAIVLTVLAQIGAIAAGVAWVVDQFVWLYKNVSSIDWKQLGLDIVTGIANGISSAASLIWDSLKGAVMGAVKNVKNLLESHSPSELMRREVGYQMGAGVALGNDDAAPEIARSSKAMVQAGADAAGGAAAPSVGTADGRSFTFNNCNFGENTESGLRKMLMALLESETYRAPEPA